MTLDTSFFLNDPARELGVGQTLEFDKNPTVLLVFAANRFTRNAARVYQDKYGIGAMDWRMLVMLTKEPNIPVARASRVIGIDKAAVSRSLGRLYEKQLALPTIPEGDARRKIWKLSSEGVMLHSEILKDALGRQQKILKNFSDRDVVQFNDYLQRLLDNLEALE